MKRIYFLLFALIPTISFDCQRELSYVNLNGANLNPFPITSTLQGNILDENGYPAMGVTIKIGNKTATTNAKGYFRIVNAPLDRKVTLVTAEKTGYFKACRTFSATSGVNQVVIKLIRKNLVGTINGGSGGDVTLSNGSKISLPANGVMTNSGGNYSGVINVYASSIDPTARDISQTIPGSFTADDKANHRVVLTSFGMLAVELQSTSGEKLQVATGSTATLTMTIPSSLQSNAPSSISFWYLDEQTGIWKEDGQAMKNGSNYVGQVKHFSFWNCDVSSTAILLSMTLHTADGDPLIHAMVSLTTPNSSSSYGWTDSLGQVSGHVPSNEPLLLEVLAYPCHTVIYSQNIGPFIQNTNLGAVTIPPNSSSGIVTVQGKLLNCNNIPVTNGYAIIYYDNIVRYASTNGTGDFSTNLTVCSNSPTTYDVLGVDNAAKQQGSVVTNVIVSPVTNAGNISACGTSSTEYINYTLDGTNYSIISNPNDTIRSDSYMIQGTYPNYTSFVGFSYPNYITFGYSHNATTGNFPLNFLTVQNYDSLTNLIQQLKINITNYPQTAGQFYEGNFTGQFTHYSTGASIHNITCTFKVRK